MSFREVCCPMSMQPSTMYLRLTEGAGEPGPDQRSVPRAAVAFVAALLLAFATPLFWAGPAFGDEGREGPAAVRSDDDDDDRSGSNSGPSGDDGDDSATTTSDRRGTTRSGTTTGTQKQVTERGAAGFDDSGTTTSNRRGTTRTGTSTGAAAQQTSGGDSGTDTGTGAQTGRD